MPTNSITYGVPADLDSKIDFLIGQIDRETNIPNKEKLKNELAPLLLQRELNLGEKLGLFIEKSKLITAISNSTGSKTWNRLVCHMGLDHENGLTLRPVFAFYKQTGDVWAEVNGVLGGGSGGGVLANSTPPPSH
jgi:hypothetical protein